MNQFEFELGYTQYAGTMKDCNSIKISFDKSFLRKHSNAADVKIKIDYAESSIDIKYASMKGSRSSFSSSSLSSSLNKVHSEPVSEGSKEI